MRVWPLSEAFCERSTSDFNESDNRQYYQVDPAMKYGHLWCNTVDKLRENLPEPLSEFRASLSGHANGEVRRAVLHVWFEELPNIRFEADIRNCVGPGVEVRLQVSCIGQDLVRYLAEYVGAPECNVGRRLRDSTALCKARVETAETDPSGGRKVAREMARQMLRMIPQIQRALIAGGYAPDNIFGVFGEIGTFRR